MIVFDKDYDGESLYDLSRDIHEAFDSNFNSIILDIPRDEFGLMTGTFNVKIEWREDDE